MDRMNREQFYAAVADLDQERLRRALWTVYWRSAAPVRERIEAEIAPPVAKRAEQSTSGSVSPDAVLREVHDFVALARSGAYMGGDRRVSRTERSRWRFTFRRLLKQARTQLTAGCGEPDPAALVALLEFASDLRDYDYFHTDDPVQAAGLVFSDEVALVWGRVQRRSGFAEFAKFAAPQFVRWEARHGWTRSGFGSVSLRETSLAEVLERMLTVPDAWITFAECYLSALDDLATSPVPGPSTRSGAFALDRRSGVLSRWHDALLGRLIDTEAEEILDRIAVHPALGGPELMFFQAKLARRRGDVERAAELITGCLAELPGHSEFLAFAQEIAVARPTRT